MELGISASSREAVYLSVYMYKSANLYYTPSGAMQDAVQIS